MNNSPVDITYLILWEFIKLSKYFAMVNNILHPHRLFLLDNEVQIYSRVICCYLVNKYGKDDSLYPNDPRKRALVDRALYFDMNILYLRSTQYMVSI